MFILNARIPWFVVLQDHLLQHRPFGGCVEAMLGSGKCAVCLEEFGVIVDVLGWYGGHLEV